MLHSCSQTRLFGCSVRMGYTGPEIVLYHAAWCRSLRVRMLLEELCVPYKLVVKR